MNMQRNGRQPVKIFFPPRKDSYVAEYSAGKNYGGASYLFCNRFQGSGDVYRSLIQFDLSCFGGNHIPPGSDIVSAKVMLHLFRNEAREATTLSAYMIKQQWHEFTVNWNKQPLYANSPADTVTVQPGYLGLVLLDVTEPARGWYDGSFINLGLVLKGPENRDGILGFYSRDHDDSTLWPRLAVEYYLA